MPKKDKEKLRFEGKVFVFGDNIDTDGIIPARYLNTDNPDELAAHCMEDIDEGFARKVKSGDVIVAGENFGCGSSREHAPIAIKAIGVSCVIASSFARIFYRNAINIGLPILEIEDAPQKFKVGDRVFVDFENGIVENRSTGKIFETQPFPPFMQRIINAGGLINSVKDELKRNAG
ncbi:MAG: 3-isopropylmalate dehydratase small subunit [Spirochaetota bacterium]